MTANYNLLQKLMDHYYNSKHDKNCIFPELWLWRLDTCNCTRWTYGR